MDSEEAATKSSISCEKPPGFFPVEKSLFLDTNVVKDSNFLNVSSSSSNNSSPSGSSFVSFRSDDNGFVSSEEGFETASEKPILDYQDNETIDIGTVGKDSCETFVGFSQFSMSNKDVFVEVADNDVENFKKVGVLEGSEVEEKLVDSCEAFSGEDSSETVVRCLQFSKSIKDVLGEVSDDDVDKTNKVEVLVGGEVAEKLVDNCETFSGEDLSLNLNGRMNGMRQDNNVTEYKGNCCQLSEEGSLGKEKDIILKGDNGLEDDKIKALIGEISDSEKAEKHVLEQLRADIVQWTEGGFKVACKGDSAVEAIHVDLLGPGVEVVGEKEENETNIRQLREDIVEQTNPVDGDRITTEGDLAVGNLHMDVLEPRAAIVCNVVKTEEADGCAGNIQDNGKKRVTQDNVTDSDGVVTDDDEEEEGKILFDSTVLTALLKVAAGVGSGGNMTITSQDLSRLISFERPASLGSLVQSFRPAARPNSSNFFSPSSFADVEESVNNLSEEEKRKLEKLQSIRVRFLRLVKRLGLSGDEPLVSRVLYKLGLVAGRQSGPLFGLDAAKRTALQLEEDRIEDTDFSLNILVLGKSGVGKSATINSIFGEEKARIDAFQHATSTVKEITGVVDGVKIRVFDTPGLKSHVTEQSFNRSVLSSVKKFTKKSPLDVVLYVDRLDAQTRDLDDLPLLQTINSSLGSSILQNAIVTLTHAASPPPEGPSGSPITYDMFIAQRSRVLHQSIGQAVGDRYMSPNQVCLVENHLLCRKNREGQKVLPNGQIWKQELMILCYSIKIVTEANSFSKSQEPFNTRRLFGYLNRLPSHLFPFLMSSTLQSHVHQKLLSSEQGGYNCDADIDLEDLSDSDKEEDDEYEYDQLPPFKPLKKSQLSKLSKEQRKAYFEEYDYRVKVLQKKQWKEELKRMKAMKMKDRDSTNDYVYTDENPADEGSSPLPALPAPVLPPSFDGDEQAHRYRFPEPTSQFLACPVLDALGWDHDIGYDGVTLLQNIATASKFPAEIYVQLTKDKKEFAINLESKIATKHGEKGSSMACFDIINKGRQPAYIIRGETKFKNFKKNKTAAGITITCIGENVVTGFKVEDQITFGRQYSLVASAGMVRSQQDVAYGANIHIQRREHDYPIGQIQSSFILSILMRHMGELCLMLSSSTQFSIGRNSKVAVRAQVNDNLTGQISVGTSSSESHFVLASIIYFAIPICKKLFTGAG